MDNFTQITVQEAHEILSNGAGVSIADIRDVNSFTQGHIDRAQNVNDENIEDFLKTADKISPLICYCYHGISSQRAASYFVQQGFKEVYSIVGGWEAWKSAYG